MRRPFRCHRGPEPVVVICHSFMSFKDWGFFPHAAERIAGKDSRRSRSIFPGTAFPPGSDRINDFDAFASNSFSREIDDLGCVVSAVRDEVCA